MYAEDLDLSRRIGEISRTVFFPKVTVYHRYDKGSYRNFKLLIYHVLYKRIEKINKVWCKKVIFLYPIYRNRGVYLAVNINYDFNFTKD